MTLEQIYNQNKNLVYNLALQYVQNIEDAEEITQDVFLAIHSALGSFQEQSNIATWIYRITINKSLDFIKAKKRKKRFAFLTSIFFAGSNEIEHDLPNFNHPGVELENKEALAALFVKINLLPDSQKTALILNKIEGQSVSEIAVIMQLSTKAVESLIQRAKKNLAQKISDAKESEKIVV